MKLGLIGAGRWGRCYIDTIASMKELQLIHVGSCNDNTRRLVTNDCVVTQSWQEVTRNQALDGLIIVTPPDLHFEMAVAAMSAGIPVLIEKPLTLSLDEAKKLLDVEKQTETLVMVGHTHLFSSAYRELKNIGQHLGTLRQVTSIGANWGPFRKDTSMMWDYAPHDLAMCLDLFEQYPKSITVQKKKELKTKEGMGETIEIELDFGRSAIATIKVSNIESKKQRYFEADYELGKLIYDDLEPECKLKLKTNRSIILPIPLSPIRPLTYVLSEFCQKILLGILNDPSLSLGVQVVRLLESCQESLDCENTILV